MPFGILLVLWMLLVGNCEADVHFTTRRWEVELGKPLLITWADANGAVNVTLVKATTGGLYETIEIIENYTENTFMWTPRKDTGLDESVLRICDEWSVDESPRLLLSGYHLQDLVRRNISDGDDKGGNNDGLPPGAAAGISVGSTLGGIFLLALVAFLIYRGRKNRTKSQYQETDGYNNVGRQKQKEPETNTGAV